MSLAEFSLEPDLIQLQYGGWLATSGRQTKLRIGVIGKTRDEARDLFAAALRRWKELFEGEEAKA